MGYPEFTGWSPDELAALKEAGMDDDEMAERAEAWDENPDHQRLFLSRYDHESRQRNRMHIDITPFEDRRASREEFEAEHDRLVGLGASEEKTLAGMWGPLEEASVLGVAVPAGAGERHVELENALNRKFCRNGVAGLDRGVKLAVYPFEFVPFPIGLYSGKRKSVQLGVDVVFGRGSQYWVRAFGDENVGEHVAARKEVRGVTGFQGLSDIVEGDQELIRCFLCERGDGYASDPAEKCANRLKIIEGCRGVGVRDACEALGFGFDEADSGEFDECFPDRCAGHAEPAHEFVVFEVFARLEGVVEDRGLDLLDRNLPQRTAFNGLMVRFRDGHSQVFQGTDFGMVTYAC
jgi:hypothetical protein